jgi:hypothetical protein
LRGPRRETSWDREFHFLRLRRRRGDYGAEKRVSNAVGGEISKRTGRLGGDVSVTLSLLQRKGGMGKQTILVSRQDT